MRPSPKTLQEISGKKTKEMMRAMMNGGDLQKEKLTSMLSIYVENKSFVGWLNEFALDLIRDDIKNKHKDNESPALITVLKGAGIDIKKLTHESPLLEQALLARNVEITNLLAENGATIYEEVGLDIGGGGGAAGVNAAEERKLVINVGKALDTDLKDTALHLAARYDCKQVVSQLTKGRVGARIVNKVNRFKSTPLHTACYDANYGIAKLLIDAGAKVDAIDRFGLTALQHACIYGYTDLVPLLIDAGAVVNEAQEDEKIPLFLACDRNQDKVVAKLIECGANVDVTIGGKSLIEVVRDGVPDGEESPILAQLTQASRSEDLNPAKRRRVDPDGYDGECESEQSDGQDEPGESPDTYSVHKVGQDEERRPGF